AVGCGMAPNPPAPVFGVPPGQLRQVRPSWLRTTGALAVDAAGARRRRHCSSRLYFHDWISTSHRHGAVGMADDLHRTVTAPTTRGELSDERNVALPRPAGPRASGQRHAVGHDRCVPYALAGQFNCTVTRPSVVAEPSSTAPNHTPPAAVVDTGVPAPFRPSLLPVVMPDADAVEVAHLLTPTYMTSAIWPDVGLFWRIPTMRSVDV